MCGIAGIIQRENKLDLEEGIEKMLSVITHRGPDDEGCYFSRDGIVGLGHRRLSIIDLSDRGRQPMQYLGRYHITFNGEIYNYREIRKELQGKGYLFETDTDTEVLLAAYCEWGERCVDHFIGMWAFAIYDDKKEVLFCSRDRFGVKPLYYYKDESLFLFGSEIKELLELIPGPVRADMKRVSAFLSVGIMDYDNGTMFADIKQLRGGHNIVVDCKSLKISRKRYYDLRMISYNCMTKNQNEDRFRELFMDAVRLRLRSDVSVGSCLSGGLDSSAIVCAVKEIKGTEADGAGQVTISSCFKEKKYDEQEYIDEVLKRTGIKGYKVFPDMDDLFAELDRIIWHMDEPFDGTSIYAQWNVFKEAKKHGVTVMLDGQGSDEQMAGYTPFYNVFFLELLRKGRWRKLFKEVKAYQKDRSSTESMPFLDVMLSLVTTCFFTDDLRFKLNRRYVKKVTGNPFPRWMYEGKIQKKWYRAYDKRDAQKYIYAGMNMGICSLLHYEDRNSMAHSIEARVPFLDHKLAEFVFSVPMEYKIVDGRTKNLIREGLKDILPEAVYNRISKLGFVTPEEKWIEENGEQFYRELEKACDRLKNIIDKKRVLSCYKKHFSSIRSGDSTFFRIICCARWADIFHVEFDKVS